MKIVTVYPVLRSAPVIPDAIAMLLAGGTIAGHIEAGQIG